MRLYTESRLVQIGTNVSFAHHPNPRMRKASTSMPANSVRLIFDTVTFSDFREVRVTREVYISPHRARRLRREKLATVFSFDPYVLKLKSCGQENLTFQRWTPTSDHHVMSGTFFEQNPPSA